jgi:hypothetical protein
MWKTVSALVLLCPVAASAAPADNLASAPGTTIVTEITAPQLIELLQAKGFTGKEVLGDDGSPEVESTLANGDTFEVLMYGCNEAKAKACNMLQLRATYTVTANKIKAVNTFNNAWVLGRGRYTDDGKAVVESAIDLEGGVTIDNLKVGFDQWSGIVGDFTDAIDK